MKNFKIVSTVLFILFLAACGTAAASNETNSASPEQIRNRDQTNADFEQPLSTQLIFGTFGLESTTYTVDAEQAAELLPLWKAARSLSESETVAAVEMEAIFNQIAESMTPEQMAEIENLAFGQQEFAAIAKEMGIEIAIGGGQGFNLDDMTPEEQATLQTARESGEGPPGGFGGGLPGAEGRGPGGGGPGGEALSPEARETAIAARGDQFGAGRGFANPVFFDAIIQLLEGKIQ